MLLSICGIVKNEEKLLPRLLDSIAPLADRGDVQCVIGDTGSTDNTLSILSYRSWVRTRQVEWANDFAAARNRVHAQADGEWILSVDGDYWFQEGSLVSFIDRLKSVPENVDGLMVTLVDTSAGYVRCQTRPLAVRSKISFRGRVHEYPALEKSVVAIDPLRINHERKESARDKAAKDRRYEEILWLEHDQDKSDLHPYSYLLSALLQRDDVGGIHSLLSVKPVWTSHDFGILANAYLRENNPTWAKLAARTGLFLQSDDPRCLVCFGDSHAATGGMREALDLYARAMRVTWDGLQARGCFDYSEDEIVVAPRMAYAALCADLGDKKNAIKALREILTKYPHTTQRPIVERNIRTLGYAI